MDPKEFKRLLSAYRPVRSSDYVGKAWFDPKGAAATSNSPSPKASPKVDARKTAKAARAARAESGGGAGGGGGGGAGDDFWAHLSAGFARHQQQACGKTAAEATAIAAALVRRARDFHRR